MTRFVTNADKLLDHRKDWASKAANLLTGSRVTDVDTEKARAIDLRSELERILQEQPHLSRYTSFYVKPEQAANLSPQEIEMMRLYAGVQRRAQEYAVSNGLGEAHYFGQSEPKPKPVVSGETGPGSGTWELGRFRLTVGGVARLVMRADGMTRTASGRSWLVSAPEAGPSEVHGFLGPTPSSPSLWSTSRGTSASTAAVSAEGMQYCPETCRLARVEAGEDR